jgi:hypothetical protein
MKADETVRVSYFAKVKYRTSLRSLKGEVLSMLARRSPDMLRVRVPSLKVEKVSR